MQWDDLKFVLAAARSKSFAKAAAMLKVSHTTIGRRIKALEQTTGAQLFERERDGCVPTEACLKILPVAERMESEARRALIAASGVQEEPKGIVQFHTGAWLLQHMFVPAVPSLLQTAPQLRMFFVGDVVEDKSNLPEFSLSLRFAVMAHRSEVEIELADFGYAVYRHIDARPEGRPWLSTSGGPVTMQTSQWLEASGVSLDNVPVLGNDAELVRQAIRADVGVGLLPMTLGETDPLLTRIKGGPPELVRTMRALVPRHIATTAQIRTVLDWVRDVLAVTPGVTALSKG